MMTIMVSRVWYMFMHHGCYLAVKIVSNILKKAQGRKFEKEWIQLIDFIGIIPYGIIILNYLWFQYWQKSRNWLNKGQSSSNQLTIYFAKQPI